MDPAIKNVQFEQLEICFKQIRATYQNERIFVIYIDSRDDTHGFFFIQIFNKFYKISFKRIRNFTIS